MRMHWEGQSMAKGDLKGLESCLKKAKTPADITDCENKFVTGGGTPGVQEGGKVFSDGENPSLFVTTGGKVFQQKA